MKPLNSLSLDQVNRRIEAIRVCAAQTKVSPGWIRFVRDSLGMTMKKLAERTGLALPTIQRAERSEAAGTISLKTLRTMAEAMDCDLIYAFVPRSPIKKTLENAAYRKAMRLLTIADVHMELEDQRVDRKLNDRVKQLASSLLEKGDIW